MNKRNRSEGWKHAKISGHKNESQIETLLINNKSYSDMFLKKIGKPNSKIINVSGGGPNEKNINCIFSNEKTKSKVDVYVELDDNERRNISVKKSISGQVYLITIDRFINGFEIQYNKKIPQTVKDSIMLFWGSHKDTLSIIKTYGTQPQYEKRKHRLVADTLKKYKSSYYNNLIDWFKKNIYEITDFCFSRGLSKNPEDWADLIWYKNELGENSVNDIYTIGELCRACDIKCDEEVYYGTIGGGTTIQLPFGFVQWHSPRKTIPGCMQFHHNYEKISNTMKILNL